MGGDLGGTGGTVLPKVEVGGRPMHPPPNILRSSVIGCVAKYELAKKRCNGVIICSEIEVFREEKGHMLYIEFQTVETDKIQTKYGR